MNQKLIRFPDLLSALPSSIDTALTDILSCNAITSNFGLTLSESEASELIEIKNSIVRQSGRIEFSGGIINELILEFCDSPYLTGFNYSETIAELIEIFYYFKNETLDEIDDADLIVLIKQAFDNNCNGSLELLKSRDMEILARGVREGSLQKTESEIEKDEFYQYWEGFYDEDPIE